MQNQKFDKNKNYIFRKCLAIKNVSEFTKWMDKLDGQKVTPISNYVGKIEKNYKVAAYVASEWCEEVE